jgi:uncharacterized membrane protein YhhN
MSLFLIVLVVVWAIAYVLGMAFKEPKANGTRRLPLWTKLVMITATLALALHWFFMPDAHHAAAAYLIVAGLVAGAVGDLILADVFPLRRTEIAAMGVFGVGHFLYIAAVLVARRTYALAGPGPLIAAVGGAALAVIAWRALVYNPTGSRTLNTGSLVYGVLLLITTGLAIDLTIESGALLTLAPGIILFAASDVILAQSMIRRRGTPLLRDIVWIIYSGGQMLIAYSVGQVLDVAARALR